MSEVVLVVGDDWEGLYIDGELKRENHSLTTDEVLDTVGIEYEYVHVEGDEHWEAWGGTLPAGLAAVRKELMHG